MASRVGPRSVKDATRFTSTIPHATSKQASAGAKASRIPGESPEQRVKRLRQAHLAAQRAQISQTDKIVDASRRFFDVAHKWTVGALVTFTVVAGVVSIYSVWDMLRYNRARRNEWLEAQKRLEADTLASARIAYLKGTATEEQIVLVDEANREAEETGIKLPPLISPPEHKTHFEENIQPAFSANPNGKGILGIVSGLFGGGGSNTTTKQESDASSSSSPSTVVDGAVESIEAGASYVQDKARSAWEQEKENQRKGGTLDQLGVATAGTSQTPTKKGWWPW